MKRVIKSSDYVPDMTERYPEGEPRDYEFSYFEPDDFGYTDEEESRRSSEPSVLDSRDYSRRR